MADTDLAARIAALALLVATRLDEDEAAARATTERQPYDEWDAVGAGDADDIALSNWRVVRIALVERNPGAKSIAEFIARNDPARALRRVKARREEVAAVLAEEHYDNQNSYYLCSQAEGCSDWDRKGKPCDCGRDQRVARMLDIIAGE